MYMLCSTNPLSLYNITLIQEAVGNKKVHLLFVHSVTGCDTTSALFGLGKKKAIDLLDQYNNDNSFGVFISGSTIKEIISSVCEKFILKLYGAQKSLTNTDTYGTIRPSVDHHCLLRSNLNHSRPHHELHTFM